MATFIVMMFALLLTILLWPSATIALSSPGQWVFDLRTQSSGIVVIESAIVSPTLALFFDRASDDPLQIDGHSAWGALWDLKSNAVTALNVVTNSWCAGGALLSNGTLVGFDDVTASLF